MIFLLARYCNLLEVSWSSPSVVVLVHLEPAPDCEHQCRWSPRCWSRREAGGRRRLPAPRISRRRRARWASLRARKKSAMSKLTSRDRRRNVELLVDLAKDSRVTFRKCDQFGVDLLGYVERRQRGGEQLSGNCWPHGAARHVARNLTDGFCPSCPGQFEEVEVVSVLIV